MPPHHHTSIELEGRIVDVFAHRFVVDTAQGRFLADIGPHGADLFPLKPGASVIFTGEMKPSEIKIDRIAMAGEELVDVRHKPHDLDHKHDHGEADPLIAIEAVSSIGLQVLGSPRCKPKHFEVLGLRGADLIECHVEFDGHIRKEKPIAADDPRWADEVARARAS